MNQQLTSPQQYGIWHVEGLGIVVAFRGTASTEDVLVDVNITPVPLEGTFARGTPQLHWALCCKCDCPVPCCVLAYAVSSQHGDFLPAQLATMTLIICLYWQGSSCRSQQQCQPCPCAWMQLPGVHAGMLIEAHCMGWCRAGCHQGAQGVLHRCQAACRGHHCAGD